MLAAPLALPLTLPLALAIALVLTTATLSAPADAAGSPKYAQYAKTLRNDGTLKRGCHDYVYRYKINPPPDSTTWALETILIDRRGVSVASGGVSKGSDPKRGRSTFRFCFSNTVPGTFHIKGRFGYKVGNSNAMTGRIKTTYFKLRLAS
ncbi:hypothetical protein [Nocardioides acrostichi]|uniref:Secreted protein n=1 Tax=Nocardioides acrostichi TaxID=2784339 RepID=A0A930UZZ9_9ACTN|nr:hypothetical protein [Nocardioides acrostichi]MBF4162867.1 hypothetical protein [Nocardioides acrostichi]